MLDKKESINTVLTFETKSIEKDKIKGLINKLYLLSLLIFSSKS